MQSTTRAKRFLAEAEAHFDSLYRYALYLTREVVNAEDLLQGTLLQAYQSFHRYIPGSNCRAWLFKIMKNLHLMTLREREVGRRTSVETGNAASCDPSFIEELYPAPLTPEELLVRKASVVEVRAELDRMPALFRDVILLVDVEGLTYEEAANVLGCATGTIKSRLYRARNMLKAGLLWQGSSEKDSNLRSRTDEM